MKYRKLYIEINNLFQFWNWNLKDAPVWKMLLYAPVWRIRHVNFDFKIIRDHQKNFLWASRLWVGRRKEPILDYVPKNDKKRIQEVKIYLLEKCSIVAVYEMHELKRT